MPTSRRTRATAKTSKPRREPARILKPHPLAWETALRLAGGDASRLLVTKSTEVVVLNHPQR